MSDTAIFSGPDSTAAAERQWFVIYTKARQEAIAETNLNRQGYTTYLPRLQVTKRRQGSVTSLIEPFFPRYLFIQLNQKTDNWAPIRSTRGVTSLVRFQGKPQPIPLSLIEALKNNENTEQCQTLEAKSWQPGDHVEIEQGPFAGYRCIFEAKRGLERVAVLLDLLGKPTRATLDRTDLQLPQYGAL